MNGPASDVFISYKAEDRKRLTPLVKALEDEGFDVWWDQHIGSGTDWRDEIETHLDAAKVVIVVWSKKTIGPEGRFVRDEAGQAQEAGHYLPITVDNVRPPLGFREVQALDLSSWKGNRADPRFQVLADTIRHRLAGKEIRRKALVVSNAPVSRRGVMIGGGAATAAVAAGVLGWEFLMPSAANAKRIAVLPFANLSSDKEQAYFSEGVTEELRGALSRIGLEVIGRASSNEVKDLNTKAAAAKLGVANILTGTVRRSPDMIRVNAQLVSAADGVERWAQSYDRAPGDAIKIQTDIATNVAQALSIALGQAARAAIALGGTADSLAQDLVLRARQLRGDADGQEALQSSVSLADEASSRDPNYADAYVAKADALTALGNNYPSSAAALAKQLALAEAALRKALELAPNLGSAHITLANLESSQLEFRSALQSTRRALALAPNDPYVLLLAIQIIIYLGDGQEGLRHADRVIALDPLNSRSYRLKTEALVSLRQYQEAIKAGRRAIELAPNAANVRTFIAYSLILLGRPAEAVAEMRTVRADDPFRHITEGLAAVRSRDHGRDGRTIAELKQMLGDTWSYQYAQLHAQAGDQDAAFAELDLALRARDPGLIYAKTDPFLDPIREDPRYLALIRKLNFP